MAELEAESGLAVGVDEIDDAAPRLDMLRRVEPGAARADPALGRDAGHFGVDQARPALRPLAIMDEVEIVRAAVDRRIHRHRRDDDAILEAHVAQPERREHRRRGLVYRRPARLRLEPAL